LNGRIGTAQSLFGNIIMGFLTYSIFDLLHNKTITRFEKNAESPVNTEKFIFMGL
jgi:hypothetical protein